jgi:membrane protease subunit HflK
MSSATAEVRIFDEPQRPEPPRGYFFGAKRRWLAATGVVWLFSGIYIVRTDQQAVVTRFGAVVEPRVYSGIHYALPWPLDRVIKVKVNQLQRLVVGGDVADDVLGRSQPLAAQFLTGDQNIINMRAVVQYSVAVPADYLFHAADIVKTIGSVTEAELARRVARRGVDAVLTTERTAIQEEVLGVAQARLNEYWTGVKLSTINIEHAAPPPEAAEAFRDVASARADTARIIDEAHGYNNDLIPRARGEAMQLSESAAAYRQAKTNEAIGDAARFSAIEAEYAKAPAVTGQRLYLEAMEETLPKIRKLIIDRNGNIDLSIVRKGDQTPKP